MESLVNMLKYFPHLVTLLIKNASFSEKMLLNCPNITSLSIESKNITIITKDIENIANDIASLVKGNMETLEITHDKDTYDMNSILDVTTKNIVN